MSRCGRTNRNRKTLDEQRILAACNKATCKAIAKELSESYFTVRRHLFDLVRKQRLKSERDGLYVRYTRA
jgi:predicted ArsR family transcriptional regulator